MNLTQVTSHRSTADDRPCCLDTDDMQPRKSRQLLKPMYSRISSSELAYQSSVGTYVWLACARRLSRALHLRPISKAQLTAGVHSKPADGTTGVRIVYIVLKKIPDDRIGRSPKSLNHDLRFQSRSVRPKRISGSRRGPLQTKLCRDVQVIMWKQNSAENNRFFM